MLPGLLDEAVELVLARRGVGLRDRSHAQQQVRALGQPRATIRFSQLWSAKTSDTVFAQVVARTQVRSSPVTGSGIR